MIIKVSNVSNTQEYDFALIDCNESVKILKLTQKILSGSIFITIFIGLIMMITLVYGGIVIMINFNEHQIDMLIMACAEIRWVIKQKVQKSLYEN